MVRSKGRPSASKNTPLKRALSPPSKLSAPPSRQSKRLKFSPLGSSSNAKSTPKKSQYFHTSSLSSEPESDIEEEASGYEDEDASASAISSLPESEQSEEEEIQEYTSEDEKPRRKSRGKGQKKSKASGVVAAIKGAVEKGKELWRPGVKSDLAPGEEVFVKLPKARGDGGIKYQEGVIHPNTMLFLGDLAENNDREWLKVHDADYRQSKKNWDEFVEKITEKIVEKDETIPELPAKDLTFRIYRDIRFSSDPTPYKTHFSAAWSRTGRKGPYAAYYLQIKPSGSFVGGGYWQPEAQPLSLLRQDVDRKSHKLKNVFMEPAIRKEFFGGVASDEKKVVKAFVAQNQANALKTKPKASTPNFLAVHFF